MGFTDQEILKQFYNIETVHVTSKKIERELDFDWIVGTRAYNDILDPKNGSVLIKQGKKYTKVSVKKMKEAGLKRLTATSDEIIGKIVADDIIDPKTGEVICQSNEALTESKLAELIDFGVKAIKVLYIDMVNFGDQIRNTLLLDKSISYEDALAKNL